MTSNWTNITSFSSLPGIANDISSGSFWTGILVMIFGVTFLITIEYGFNTAMMIAGFVGLVLGLLLFSAGLMAQWIVWVFLSVLVFGMLIAYFQSRGE